MARYDLVLTRPDGDIHAVVPLHAADDAQAEHAAKADAHPQWRELWEGSRLVGRYTPPGL